MLGPAPKNRRQIPTAPAYMARAVLGFNEQLERLGELAVVLVVGAMLADIEVLGPGVWLALTLFVVIRPAATLLTLFRVPMSRPQRKRSSHGSASAE